MKNETYCKFCNSCGEETCCSPIMCKHKFGGLYCEHYLNELKIAYLTLTELHKDDSLVDKIWEIENKIIDEQKISNINS